MITSHGAFAKYSSFSVTKLQEIICLPSEEISKEDNLNLDSGPATERNWVKKAGFDIAYCPAVFDTLLALSVMKHPCKAKEPS